MAEKFTLEPAWGSQLRKAYKIEFEEAPSEDGHFMFLFTATAADQAPFIFKASVSPILVQKLGIDATATPKKLMKAIAGKGLGDLKTRLNAGHDTNFNNLPYIKTYTLRDKDSFAQFL